MSPSFDLILAPIFMFDPTSQETTSTFTNKIMSGSRLTTVYSGVLRSVELSPRSYVSLPRSRAKATAFFHTSRSRQQDTKPTRYGTAKEVPPHLQTKIGGEAEFTNLEHLDTESIETSATFASFNSPTIQLLAAPKEPLQTPNPDIQAESVVAESKSPLDRVIDMNSPNLPEDDKPPHLQAPRYVHHFDTFSLVRDLQKGGFTEKQTVDIMKAIRGLLAENMNLARRALVSKSNVENVCSAWRCGSYDGS
jgi:hypothetical protein